MDCAGLDCPSSSCYELGFDRRAFAVLCRHDHIFGNFRTADGRVRRIDIIIASAEECAFCVLGWTGSRQYLRFLRQHAVDLGMALNSHRQVPPADEPKGTTCIPACWAG